MHIKNILVYTAAALLLAGTPLAAEDLDDLLFGETLEDELFGSPSEEEDLFGEDSLIQLIEESETDQTEDLLTNEDGAVITGSYSFSLQPQVIWDLEDTFTWGLSANLSSELTLDARPTSETRFFANAEISYPFTVDEELTDSDLAPNEEDNVIVTSRSFDDIIHITEMFGDFIIGDDYFFRVGKQSLNWGVGYFFSPANLLNVEQIDPEDADADLEGPLSVKLNRPVGMDNLYGYVIIPDGAEEPQDVKLAAKYEKVIGSSEVGIGAVYQYGSAPALMATLSTSTIYDISVFAEGVVKYGSDATYTSSTFSTIELDDDRLYASGTAGFLLSDSLEDSDMSYSLTGQYYYNGEGYDGDDLFANPFERSGFHYGGAIASFSFNGDVSTSVLWYGNLGDGSGIVTPSISWSPDENISLALGAGYTYGDDDGQMSLGGSRLAPYIAVSLGGEDF